MRVLSLCDGMSCAQIALNRSGIKYDTYYASEIDNYAIKVTQQNFPKTTQLGDIKSVKNITDVGLLFGGTPCQGFSRAGKRLNFNDPRSALFFEFVRVLKETKPKNFLFENVKMKKENQDIISKHLGVEPVFINSSLVSAQLRGRVYWSNIEITHPADKKIMLSDIIENGCVDRDKSYCIDANYYKSGDLKSYFERRRRQLVFLNDEKFRKLTPIECERLQTVPDDYTSSVSNMQRYKMLGNGFTIDIICHILKGL